MENKETVATETKVRQVMIGLWATGRKGFAVSHKDGLTKEQVEVFHALKIGDRLKLWSNDPSPIVNRPQFSLGTLEDNQSPQ